MSTCDSMHPRPLLPARPGPHSGGWPERIGCPKAPSLWRGDPAFRSPRYFSVAESQFASPSIWCRSSSSLSRVRFIHSRTVSTLCERSHVNSFETRAALSARPPSLSTRSSGDVTMRAQHFCSPPTRDFIASRFVSVLRHCPGTRFQNGSEAGCDPSFRILGAQPRNWVKS